MDRATQWQRIFIGSWLVVQIAKCALAVVVPPFVDEAFYWQESQHLALVYSDLPGCTAWLIRLGVWLGGDDVVAMRAPFLAMSALIPWLVARMSGRILGARAGWMAGVFVTLMPLTSSLGLLALPDVPLALATVLCLDALTQVLRQITPAALGQLVVGLVLGAFTHYRFIGVIGAGGCALIGLASARTVWRQPSLWLALFIGLLAWLPLLLWNHDHHQAGLRFQLIDRHPWHFQARGIRFVLIQVTLLTPPFAWMCAQMVMMAWRSQPPRPIQWRYWVLCGGASTLGYFLLGFFADQQRVSFHWPLPGYLAWLAAAPVLIQRVGRWSQRLIWAGLVAVTACVFIGFAVIANPAWRERTSGTPLYPRNFVGWDELAAAIQPLVASQPAQTLVVDQFKVGAELGFRLHRAEIRVLPSPLNARHGRREQLHDWGLIYGPNMPRPRLLILAPSQVPYRSLLARYHFICDLLGPLPPAHTVMTPHGDQRFLVFRLSPQRPSGRCTTPVMASIDAPEANTLVQQTLDVRGWAFKDGVGVAQVRVSIDGQFYGRAHYGLDRDIRRFWPQSTDPYHPAVGFSLRLPVAKLAKGRHWLSIQVIGQDGGVEDGWFVPWLKQQRP